MPGYYMLVITLTTSTAVAATIPPSGVRLLNVAMNGLRWNPSLACQGAICDELPVSTRAFDSYASRTSCPSLRSAESYMESQAMPEAKIRSKPVTLAPATAIFLPTLI
jgi:hypothetical protein